MLELKYFLFTKLTLSFALEISGLNVGKIKKKFILLSLSAQNYLVIILFLLKANNNLLLLDKVFVIQEHDQGWGKCFQPTKRGASW